MGQEKGTLLRAVYAPERCPMRISMGKSTPMIMGGLCFSLLPPTPPSTPLPSVVPSPSP